MFKNKRPWILKLLLLYMLGSSSVSYRMLSDAGRYYHAIEGVNNYSRPRKTLSYNGRSERCYHFHGGAIVADELY